MDFKVYFKNFNKISLLLLILLIFNTRANILTPEIICNKKRIQAKEGDNTLKYAENGAPIMIDTPEYLSCLKTEIEKAQEQALAKEQLTASKEECKEVSEQFRSDTKDKEEEQKTLIEKETDLGNDIRTTEKELATSSKTLQTTLNDLRNKTNEELQKIKDNVREDIAQKVQKQSEQIKNKIYELKNELEKSQLATDKVFADRRIAQNKRYIDCYAGAEKNMQSEQGLISAKNSKGKLARNNLQSLAQGTKSNLKGFLKKRFSQRLHFCLNNQEALKLKQAEDEQFNLQLKQIALQKKRIKTQISLLESQFQNLQVHTQSQILTASKEKLQMLVKKLNEDYTLHTNNFEQDKKQIQKKITALNQQRGQNEMQKAKSTRLTSQEQRTSVLLHECDQKSDRRKIASQFSPNEDNRTGAELAQDILDGRNRKYSVGWPGGGAIK